MSYPPRLLPLLVATIFLVFGMGQQILAEEDTRPGHLYILADQSHSMYQVGLRSIDTQVTGITDALLGYQAACGHVAVSYFAWGNTAGPIAVANTSNEETMIDLANFVLREAAVDRVATNHAIAWSTFLDQYTLAERTVVVFITNGDSYRGVFETAPGVTVHKVALQFKSAKEYLEQNFLPGVGTVHLVHREDELSEVITDVLRGLDTACTG